MADEVKKEEVKPVEKKVDVRKFRNRILVCVNKMENRAKAEAVARRVLRNN